MIGRQLTTLSRITAAIFAVFAVLITPGMAAERLSFELLKVVDPAADFDMICCAGEQQPDGKLQEELKTGYGAKPHWMKFVDPAEPGLMVLTAIVDEAVLYVRNPATGVVRTSRLGDTLPASIRELLSARLAFPLTDADAGAELFMKIIQPVNITLRFEMTSVKQFVFSDSRTNTIRAFLIGGILTIILYNLVLSVIARDATFLLNGAAIFCLLLLDLYLSGVGAAYLWDGMPWLSNRLLLVSLSGPGIFGCVFVYLFVRKPGRAGFRHNGIFFVLPALAILALLSQFLIPYWLVQPMIILLGMSVLLFLTAICGVYAWNGETRAKVMLVPLLMAVTPGLVIVAVQKLFGVEFGDLDQHLLEITLTFEALLFSFALAYRIRLAEQEREVAHATLDAHNTQARKNLLVTIDEERTRIASELHETAGYGLLAVASRLTHIGSAKKLSKQMRDELGEISDVSKVLVGEIRRISHDLHSSALEHLGFEQIIEDLLEYVRMAGLKARPFDVGVDEASLTQEQKSQLYRIIQELLTNIVKHAHASEVSISLKKQGELAILIIKDNGQGLPADESSDHSGLGLGIARQRVEALGATWDTNSGSDGTTVKLTFPLSRGSRRTEPGKKDSSSGGQSSDFSGRNSSPD